MKTFADLREFRFCGLAGHNYESYYTKHGFPRSVEILKTSAGLPSVFRMVSLDRCDVVETHPQAVLGAMLTGELQMPEDIACQKLVSDSQRFYLMVSKNSPRAEKLVTQLSTALIRLERAGNWMTIEDEGVFPAGGYADMRKCL